MFEESTPWEIVQFARHTDRPQARDYIQLMCDDFVELHGDRTFGDDRSVIAGFAKIDDCRFLVIGHDKGRAVQERNDCFFGCAHPEGFRKSLAKMRLAAKFRLPIVCLIDTPGAYSGIDAEERGQAWSISANLRAMATLPVPIICIVIGEGGAGGALAVGIGDYAGILQFAYYSVVSPEGCAGRLWHDARFVAEAAVALKLTAHDLLQFGAVDEVIPEPPGGAHQFHRVMAGTLKSKIVEVLKSLRTLSTAELLNRRYLRLRQFGDFAETA